MKLGAIGALAGVGKGIMENAAERNKQAAAAEQARIDEARDKRLADYKATAEAAARTSEHEHDVNMSGITPAATTATNTAAMERQAAADKSKASEGVLDRESAERIAAMNQTGRETDASVKAKERFEPRTSTVVKKDASGIPYNEDVTTLYDKDTKATLIQQGQRFVPQGTDLASVRSAPASAIDMLIEDPTLANYFLEKYKYLPSQYVEALPATRKK